MNKESQRKMVLQALEPINGKPVTMTREKLSNITKIPEKSICFRVRELIDTGLIKKMYSEPTASGRLAESLGLVRHA